MKSCRYLAVLTLALFFLPLPALAISVEVDGTTRNELEIGPVSRNLGRRLFYPLIPLDVGTARIIVIANADGPPVSDNLPGKVETKLTPGIFDSDILISENQFEDRKAEGQGNAKAEAMAIFSGIPKVFGFEVKGASIGIVTGLDAKATETVKASNTDNRTRASAIANVIDPLPLSGLVGDEEYEIALILEAGFSLLAEGTGSRARRTVEAGTSLTGLEVLYELALGVTGTQAGPILDIDFVSNPVLGLVDSEIVDTLRSALGFEVTTGTFSLSSDLELFRASFQPGVTAFVFSTSDRALAEIVPQVSTLGLVAIGMLNVVAYGWLRRKRQRFLGGG